jgi:tripartite-type tricarboxylate transporter receptor subunit TctC
MKSLEKTHRAAHTAARLGTLAALCAAFFPAAAIAPAHAQKYPDKPIRLIIPFAPGGGTDVLARFMAAKLSEDLGVTLVIDNRAGAGGTLGAELAARAAPDGYTLLFTSASYSFNPSLRKLRFDPLKDLTPVTLIAMVPHLLVVHPSMPVNSVKELVALAQRRPGEIFYGSGGAGSSIHLAAVLFVNTAKVKMTHVPYKGGGPAMTAMLAGEVQVLFPTMQSAMPLVNAGRLRPLAISTAKRSPALPKLPTIAEAGVPGYDATGWYGMLAPAGTPKGAIDRLHAAVAKTLSVPATKQRLANEGATAVGNTPAEFDKFLRDEIAKWRTIIRALGLKVD